MDDKYLNWGIFLSVFENEENSSEIYFGEILVILLVIMYIGDFLNMDIICFILDIVMMSKMKIEKRILVLIKIVLLI